MPAAVWKNRRRSRPCLPRDHPPWRASEPRPHAAAHSADRDKTRRWKRSASEWVYGAAPVRTASTLQVLRRSVGYSWIVLPRRRPLALLHLLGRLPSSLAELEAMFRRLLVGMAAFARSGGDTCLEAMSALAL